VPIRRTPRFWTVSPRHAVLRIEAAVIETARPAPDRASAAEVGSESRVVGSKVGFPEAKKGDPTNPTIPQSKRTAPPPSSRR
jgi:hypothetical protein